MARAAGDARVRESGDLAVREGTLLPFDLVRPEGPALPTYDGDDAGQLPVLSGQAASVGVPACGAPIRQTCR